MKSCITILRISTTLFCLAFSHISLAAIVYVAEVDSSQSFVFIDGAGPSRISGALRIFVDGNSIQFENVDLLITPEDYLSSGLIIPAIGDYDGINFNYMDGPPTLDAIPDYYNGTFDGGSLLLSGYTDYGTTLEYTINSSSVSAIPIPSSLLLFSSGVFGLFMRRRSV